MFLFARDFGLFNCFLIILSLSEKLVHYEKVPSC